MGYARSLLSAGDMRILGSGWMDLLPVFSFLVKKSLKHRYPPWWDVNLISVDPALFDKSIYFP